MFNHNIKIMNNIRNYRSLIIQLLVHNYLTHEYKTQNVFIYPELINDLDIFSTNLSNIDVLSIDGKLNTNIDIQAILDVASDEYVQSCEIKSGNIYEIADVVRNLSFKQKEKGLSTGEKKMLYNAKQILISELVLAEHSTQDEVEQLVDNKINSSYALFRTDGNIEDVSAGSIVNKFIPFNEDK